MSKSDREKTSPSSLSLELTRDFDEIMKWLDYTSYRENQLS